jgi:glycosyltransferase involved in cell wall biosynthesis
VRIAPGGNYFHAVTENCHAGPRSSAVVLAAEAYLHKWLRTYQRCVDLFLAPTEFVRAKLISAGYPAQQIEVLPHFQALPPEERLVPEKGYILYFGRLSAEKGLDELLLAMERLPHIPLVIAGEGPERDRLESMVRDLKLTHVLFAGMVGGEKLEQLIAGCCFSVFPSHAYETLGKSILESYAWGRPVVASDLGSRREMVEPGVTGLLYPVGDLERLAEAIEFLFNSSDLTVRMGAESRRRLHAQHDPDRHLDTLQEIYSRMVARKPQTATAVKPLSPQRSPSRLRVAFIGGRGVVSKYSGIESYYEQVGTELTRMGHEVTVYCRSYFTPPIAEYGGIRVRRLPTIRSKHLETLVHTFLSTAHAMFSGYDVVHYHCLGPALLSFLPRLVGKKTVVTVQGLDWQRRKWGRIASRVLRWGESAAITFPDATIVVSQTLQHYYRERHGRSTVYVPNGAILRPKHTPKRLEEWGLAPDNYVLYLGRFSPEKNCHLLIEAFEEIATGMRLVLAGGSSHSDEYVESLRRHESEQIRLLPWVSGEDLDELLSNAAVFVLPSDLEGLSLALLDAMAAGVCALTSDIPENLEVVAGAGFTFKRGDRSDLTRVLDLLIRNPALRREMAVKGAQQVQEKYLWCDIARSVEQAYYKILEWDRPADVLVTDAKRGPSAA